jgi:hypothetical protein
LFGGCGWKSVQKLTARPIGFFKAHFGGLRARSIVQGIEQDRGVVYQILSGFGEVVWGGEACGKAQMATKHPLCRKKMKADWKNGLAKLRSASRIAKKSHAGRGQESKWEIPINMGCNREPTQQEARQVLDAAKRVAVEVGADPRRAEKYLRLYDEQVAKTRLWVEKVKGREIYSGTNWLNEELKGRIDKEGNIYRGTNWLNEEQIGRVDNDGNIFRGTHWLNEKVVGRIDEKGIIHKGTNWLNEERMGRIDSKGKVHEGTNWLNEKPNGELIAKLTPVEKLKDREIYSGKSWWSEELKGRIDDKGNIYRGTNRLNEERIGRIDNDGNIFRGTHFLNEKIVGRIDDKGVIHKGKSWLSEERVGRVDREGVVQEGANWLIEKPNNELLTKFTPAEKLRGQNLYSGTNWFDEELKGRVDEQGNIYKGTNWLNEEKIGRLDNDGNIIRGTHFLNEEVVGRIDNQGNIHKGTNWFNEEKVGRIDKEGAVYQGTNWWNEKKIGRSG